MKLSIHQPSYFPWLGLLHKIANSDVYMVMDEVQLSDSAYQNRNIFLTLDGQVKFLTIPIIRKDYLNKPFCELLIAEDKWRKQHRNFIVNNYCKHPGFLEIMPKLDVYFEEQYSSLCEAVIASMKLCMVFFGIQTKVVFQSQMQYDRSLSRGELVLDLIRASNAVTYLSGTGAREYLDEKNFIHGINLEYSNFVHPVYQQSRSTSFNSGLSSLDALFNLGIADARKLMKSFINS